MTPATKLLPDGKYAARIVLDDEDSDGRVLKGFHPEHPAWLDGRWMKEDAEVRLPYFPERHTHLVINGLCEQYQLDQVGPMHLTVESEGVELLSGVVNKDGRFHFEAELPEGWKPARKEVVLKLHASPSWVGEGWSESFTVTIIEIEFEGRP